MCNSASFESLLGFGNVAGAVYLDWYELDSHHINLEELVPAGLLKKVPVDNTIRCRGCNEFIHVSPRMDSDGIKLYGDCWKCGIYELFEEETIRWRIDYSPIFAAVRKQLSCCGGITELLSGVLWNLGRAPVCGQSREVFVCAAINSSWNQEIMQHLPDGKTPILLVLGKDPAPEKLGSFSTDRVFNISHMTSLENGHIVFDSTHIQRQVETISAIKVPQKKTHGRNCMIGDAAIKIKTELRQFMQGVYSDFEQAEKSGRESVFQGIKQSQLAELAGVTPVIVSRALKKDMELKTLFDAANNPRTAYSYGRKAYA